MPENVTEVTCKARMETINEKLDAIRRDAQETRMGVGHLNRRLFEGNGGLPMDVIVQRNTDFREQREKDAEAQKRRRLRRNLAWGIAGAGWAASLFLWWLTEVVSK